MKMIYIAILILLSGVSCNVPKDKEKLEGAVTGMTLYDLLENKCKKAGVVDPNEGFNKTILKVGKCIEKQYTSENTTDSSEELCNFVNKNVRDCFKMLVDNVQLCLEPEEKYLPKFLEDVYSNFLDLVCGENFIELLATPSATKCMDELSTHNFLETCSHNASMKLLASKKDAVFKKEAVCTDLNGLYGCYEDVLKKTCPEDEVVRGISNKIHKAVSSSCNKDYM